MKPIKVSMTSSETYDIEKSGRKYIFTAECMIQSATYFGVDGHDEGKNT